MYLYRSYLKIGSGIGVVITSPKGHKLRYAIRLHFDATNNVIEYEALVNAL
jgi:ribonuclease HI